MQLRKKLTERNSAFAGHAEGIVVVFKVNCVCKNRESLRDKFDLFSRSNCFCDIFNFYVTGADLRRIGCCGVFIFYGVCKGEVNNIYIRCLLGTE